MKRLIILTSAILCLSACAKDTELYVNVSMRTVLPGGEEIRSMRIDMSDGGNYFRNLNTGQEYEFPTFTDGRADMKVLKGVYIYAFDAIAQLPDGKWISVRCAEHNAPAKAVSLLDDNAVMEINLMKL